DDLKQIKLAQLSSPNGTVWQVTEPGPNALKRLKSLKIPKPPPVLQLAWVPRYTARSGLSRMFLVVPREFPSMHPGSVKVGFENVLAEIHAEMRGVRDKLARLRTLDDAILAERDPTMWLN